MKKIVILLVSLFAVVNSMAQTYSKEYYTPDQRPMNNTLWVDNVTFTNEHTVVSMQLTGKTRGVCLLPSTKLVVHLKGDRQFMLSMTRATGIPMSPKRTTSDDDVVLFKVYFPAIPADSYGRVRSVDFIEAQARHMQTNFFNVYEIQINNKNSR